MTRTARMPKKKHLEASSWEEMRPINEDTQKDEQESRKDENSITVEKKEKKHKKKSLKRERENDIEVSDQKTATSNEEIQVKKKKKKKDATTEKTEIVKETSTDNQKKKKSKESHLADNESEAKIDNHVSAELKNANQKDDTQIKANRKRPIRQSFKVKREQKLEKQREARRLRRAKRKGFQQGLTCFQCRQIGHTTATCPETNKGGGSGVGVCYKCGSSSHTTKNCEKDTSESENPFPFAKCFICGETGHLSRSCPDNPKGLYPKGGNCNMCGSVEHLRRDCPEAIKTNSNNNKSGPSYKKMSTFASADAEVHSDDETRPSQKKFKKKKGKFVKF